MNTAEIVQTLADSTHRFAEALRSGDSSDTLRAAILALVIGVPVVAGITLGLLNMMSHQDYSSHIHEQDDIKLHIVEAEANELINENGQE